MDKLANIPRLSVSDFVLLDEQELVKETVCGTSTCVSIFRKASYYRTPMNRTLKILYVWTSGAEKYVRVAVFNPEKVEWSAHLIDTELHHCAPSVNGPRVNQTADALNLDYDNVVKAVFGTITKIFCTL